MGRKLKYGEAIFAHRKGDERTLCFIAGYHYKKKISCEVELLPDDKIIWRIIDFKTGKVHVKLYDDLIIEKRYLIDTLVC